MNGIKLKACPFCGKQPAVFPSGDGTGEMVECQNPGCINPHVSYYGKNVARQKWNARAGDREPAATQSEAAKADSLQRMVSCPMCGEPRNFFGVCTYHNDEGGDIVTESCQWCGCSAFRETWDGNSGRSPRAANESSSVTRHTERNKCKPQ